LRALHEDPSFGATPEASPNPVPAPPEVPVHRETDVVVSGEDGLRAWFPPGVRANRPIYALVDSAFGVDPAAAWRFSPAGAWKYSGIRAGTTCCPPSTGSASTTAATCRPWTWCSSR